MDNLSSDGPDWHARISEIKGRSVIEVEITGEPPESIHRLLVSAFHHEGMGRYLVEDTWENRNQLGLSTTPGQTVYSPEAERQKVMMAFEQFLRSRRYSVNTIKTYREALHTFLTFFTGRSFYDLGASDLIQFNNDYILLKKLSSSYQNQVINAVKLAFREVGDKRIDADLIQRPRREKLLPNVLSKEEVEQILRVHRNLKHRAMLSMIYSCGLRCSELLSLKPQHIDSKRKLVNIKQAKGKKDRVVPLSPKILDLLREYYTLYRPRVYLFEGQEEGQPYDSRSLQLVLKQAIRKCGINKPVTLHWLRHSYATHLLEAGTDIRYIQEILGHKSSKTTEIYTHVSTNFIQKIRSPFDDL